MNNTSLDDIMQLNDSSFFKRSHRISDPSIINHDNVSQLFQNDQMSIHEHPLNLSSNKDIGQFDIIDSLDYDDVDDGLIDQEMMHRHREALIRDLYDKEKSYVDKLGFVLHSFLIPLYKKITEPTFNFMGLKKAPCTVQELRWLSSNLEEIHVLHQHIINDFRERLIIWGPTQIISDVMLRWFSRLQSIYQVYMDNYDIMICTYDKLRKYQPFRKFVEAIEKNDTMKELKFITLLKIPNQFLPRCHDTVNALSENTSPMHPDYGGLLQCRQRIHQVFDVLKYRMDDTKNIDEVHKIHHTMVDLPFSMRMNRRLVAKDNFLRGFQRPSDYKMYYLFNDILIIARSKHSVLHYKAHMLLDLAKIRTVDPAEMNETEFCIEICSPCQNSDTINTSFMGTPTSHIIRTGSQESQMNWMKYLESTVSRLEKSIQYRGSNSISNHSSNNREESSRRQSTSTSSDSITYPLTTTSTNDSFFLSLFPYINSHRFKK